MAGPGQIDDDSKALTKEQREQIEKLLASKLKLVACELCETNNWGFNDRIVTPSFLAVNREVDLYDIDLAVIHPSLLMQCNTCGNSKLISLAVIGFNPFSETGE